MEQLYTAQLETPAYVFAEEPLLESLDRVKSIASDNRCHFLYSMKSLEYPTVLKKMLNHVEGFAASSVFEARLARELLGSSGTVHYTTPGIRSRDIPEILELCDYVTLNSGNHWRRLTPHLQGHIKIGLRINPGISLVGDERYDPCSSSSRLGMHIPEFRAHLRKNIQLLPHISGIHMHTNCEGRDFGGLLKTVEKVSRDMGDILNDMEWFNIGGGYFFEYINDEEMEHFRSAVDLLQRRHNLTVFMEPGGTIVRSSGYIVASVLDIVGPVRSKVAVLDTTINHMPEVYEYEEYTPDVIGNYGEDEYDEEYAADYDDDDYYHYTLAGASCLAGDQFGEYAFEEPLKIGQRLIFRNMGAYTMVKSHMFNGINLPNVYFVDKSGELRLERNYTYDDFLNRCSAHSTNGSL